MSTVTGSQVMFWDVNPDGRRPFSVTFIGTFFRIFFSAEILTLEGEIDEMVMPDGAVMLVWVTRIVVTPSVILDASISAVRSSFDGGGARLDIDFT